MSSGDFLSKPTISAWERNCTRNTVRANERFARLALVDPAGAALGTVAVADYEMAILPEDRASINEKIERAAAREQDHYTNTFRMIGPQGEIRTMFARGFFYRAPEGDLMFPGTLIDLGPAEIAAVRRGTHSFNELARTCQQARDHAEAQGLKVLKHLLDMTVQSIGEEVQKAAWDPRNRN